MIARRLVGRCSCNLASTFTGSRFRVRGSMSTNSGRPPVRTIELAEATKLNGVVRTVLPAWTPTAARANHSASVPEAQPSAKRAPVAADISCSKASSSGPPIRCWEAKTRSTASMISSRMEPYCRFRSSSGTCWTAESGPRDALRFEAMAWVTEECRILPSGPATQPRDYRRGGILLQRFQELLQLRLPLRKVAIKVHGLRLCHVAQSAREHRACSRHIAG